MQGFIHQLFSKVVFETRLNNSKKDLNKFIKDFKNFKVKDTSEKKNITRATESKYILNDERFKELRKVLLQQFYSFKNEALLFNNTDFEITTSWLAVSSTNCEGVPHNHRNSFYSGVYYLKVPNKSGGIKFINYNTSNFLIEPTTDNPLNTTEWRFNVQDDSLLLFPSEMYHTIMKNESKQKRISLAFNIMPKGRFGIQDSELIMAEPAISLSA